MGTDNSSVETRRRAKQLAEAIGRYVTIKGLSISYQLIHLAIILILIWILLLLLYEIYLAS